ncbi:rhamnose/proton symporter RhaT [Prolixibacteraceae bacterium JC049]|nr:rhamnose/proton symporter RhaT [Prolixibacteraceae bacterium JC049]
MNALLGIVLHAIGGLCAASFYIPIRKVKQWAWESYWIIQGVGSWILAPFLFAWLVVPKGNLGEILVNSPSDSILYAMLFGALWGIGGLSFGLSMRYLGIALGQSVALGFCTTFGTIIPPIYSGSLGEMFGSTSGVLTLVGVAICLAGIVTAGYAGTLKEKGLSAEEKLKAVKEFALTKGLLIAVFSGIMSSCMAFAIAAAKPIADLSMSYGVAEIYQKNVGFIFIMGGGFISNLIWCVYLHVRNNSLKTMLAPKFNVQAMNTMWAFAGGVTWFLQFFFYGMGASKLGEKYDFASWSIHMAFIIIFSNVIGLMLGEWKGSNKKTITMLMLAILILIISTAVIGWGAYIEGGVAGH